MKTYCAIKDRESYGLMQAHNKLEDAEKQVVNNLYRYPNAFIAVIEDGINRGEIDQNNFDLVYSYACKIVKCENWSDYYYALDHLMNLLDMDAEWIDADRENMEDVIRKAGEKIGVKLIQEK